MILEGYRPGVLSWMGIDYETLREVNPRIIVCSLSGYGQSGPYAQYPGHAPQYGGVAGAIGMGEDGEPDAAAMRAAGFVNGLYAANAILAALLEREETGEGQHIDVSMLGALMSLTLPDAARYFRDGELPRPRVRSGSIGYLRCKDGRYISTANSETLFWENFCRLIERPQYIPLRGGSGPEFDAMTADVKAIFLTRTRDEWLPLLQEAETCAAPVNTIAEAFVDPQVQHIGMVWNMQHPTEGAVRQLGSPARFSRTPVAFERFAPVLGEHTREVLAEAGFAPDEIAALEDEGTVKSWTGDGWAAAATLAEG